MSEQSLWQWLKEAKRQKMKHPLHMERVENSAGAGIPDVIGCYRAVPFFLELKYCKKAPVRLTTKVRFEVRPSQWSWHDSWYRAGGESWFLIQIGAGRYLVPYPRMSSAGMTLDQYEWAAVLPSTCKQREVIRRMTDRGIIAQYTP